MSNSTRRTTFIIVLLAILLLIALLLVRCSRPKSAPQPVEPHPAPAKTVQTPIPAPAAPVTPEPAEVLTPATVQVPAEVKAGAVFSVTWTGPNNKDDYLTIIRQDAPEGAYDHYRETRLGSPLELTAPIEPGAWEVRYVAARSRKVLGRAAITVAPIEATLNAADEVILGTSLAVTWTGPDNKGDYITLVPKSTADGQYSNYTETAKGSPLKITVPVTTGDAELRYMTGQGAKVLARRPIKILAPEVSLNAPAEVIAGSSVAVTWVGPNNPNDYITLVTKTTSDGQYGNYTNTSQGSPLKVNAPVTTGEAELRYMTGQGAKILARRPIKIIAAEVSLSAPVEVIAGDNVAVTWSGPNNPSDYITLVTKATPDGQYGNYTYTTQGSPLKVLVPITAGEAELRYVTGQGAKTLVRRPIKIVAAEISLSAPDEVVADSAITVTWTGPAHRGDYITVVPKGTRDGQYANYSDTNQGSPLKIKAPKEAGEAELRYMSGQGAKVLSRRPIKIIAKP